MSNASRTQSGSSDPTPVFRAGAAELSSTYLSSASEAYRYLLTDLADGTAEEFIQGLTGDLETIGRAQGIVMYREFCTREGALAILLRSSRETGEPLSAVASALVTDLST